MFRKNFSKSIITTVCILFVVAIVVFTLLFPSKTVLSQLTRTGEISKRPTGRIIVKECSPTLVANFNQRVQIRCAASINGVSFFAVSSSNIGNADRTLKLAETALISGKSLLVYFNPQDVSGESFGCRRRDCRKLFGLGLEK